MSKFNHIPGPWGVGKRDPRSVLANDGETVCWADSFGTIHEGREVANARLIAAAPDMLLVLEHALPLIDAYRRQSGGDGDVTAAAIRSVVARARGLS